MNCHDKLDGRTKWDGDRGRVKYGDGMAISAQVSYEITDTWYHAIERTQSKLIAKGLM